MTTNTNLLTINSWLIQSTEKLIKSGIATGRLDSLVLLSDVLGKDKSYLLAHPEEILTINILTKINTQIKKRVKHEPLAYIRGKSEFYGREFFVNKHTLVPRPETETMIDLFTNLYNSRKQTLQKGQPLSEKPSANWNVVDVGTGCGAIGISLKLIHPDLTVAATDISVECIRIAMKNSKLYDAKILLFKCNLINSIFKNRHFNPSFIMANLPYVPDNFPINFAATHEPQIAIFGGPDGLDVYRLLFKQLNDAESSKMESFNKPRYVFTESFPEQHSELRLIAHNSNYKLMSSEDFIQVFEIN